MDILIRQAQPADAPAIVAMVGELLHEIMAAIGSKLFGFDPDETEARARAWMADRLYRVLVAYADGESTAIGFLALYESYALSAEGAFGTIPELYGRPDFRSQGVGARLIAEAKQYATAKRWTRLEVTTPPLPQFDRTLTFYARQGFSISGGRKMKVDLS
jgi:GNAT superfamily N-acetyltransferase